MNHADQADRIEGRDGHSGKYGNEAFMALQTNSGWRGMKQRLDSGELDPNARDCEGNTLLMLAVLHNNVEAVRGLIRSGAHVNAQNQRGETALMLAARQDSPGIYVLLLDAGADVEMRDEDGRTALMWSAGMMGSSYSLLMQYGADHRARDREGMRAINYAYSCDHVSAIRYFESLDKEGVSMVTWAARYGYWHAAQAWMARGEPVNDPDADGKTPLIYAVEHGEQEMVSRLLQSGAEVSQVTEYGNTALHHAAWGGHFHAARTILASLSPESVVRELTRTNRFGNTPLMLADMAKHHRLEKMLRESLLSARRSMVGPEGADRPRMRASAAALEHYAAQLAELKGSDVPRQVVSALAEHRGRLYERMVGNDMVLDLDYQEPDVGAQCA